MTTRKRANLTGNIVLYRLTDADEIRVRMIPLERGGALTENNCQAGSTFPMMVTRDHGALVNGKVFLDADFDLPVFSVAEGDGNGTWSVLVGG
jgi:hypothetical protein